MVIHEFVSLIDMHMEIYPKRCNDVFFWAACHEHTIGFDVFLFVFQLNIIRYISNNDQRNMNIGFVGIESGYHGIHGIHGIHEPQYVYWIILVCLEWRCTHHLFGCRGHQCSVPSQSQYGFESFHSILTFEDSK